MLLVLFLPGYVTVRALFDEEKDRLNSMEILFLSAGFSLCVILNISFILNYSTGMKRFPFLALLAAYTVMTACFAYFKERRKKKFPKNKTIGRKELLLIGLTACVIFFSTYYKDFNFEHSLERFVVNGDAHFFVWIARQIMAVGHYMPERNALNYAPGLFLLLDAMFFLTRVHLLYICSFLGVLAPLFTFAGIFVLSFRFFKSIPSSLLAAFFFMTQILNYKSFVGPTFDPFMFSFILFLFLLNKPLLSGMALSTVVFTHQYPLYAAPVLTLYGVLSIVIVKQKPAPFIVMFIKLFSPVFLMMFLLSRLSPEVLSPRPVGNALDFVAGVPVRTLYRNVIGLERPLIEVYLFSCLHVLGLLGGLMFLFRLKFRKETAADREGLLYASGICLLLVFSLAQPLLFTLGIQHKIFPFDGLAKSVLDVRLDVLSDASFSGMLKRAFIWMEPGRPLLFFSIFSTMFTVYFLEYISRWSAGRKIGFAFSLFLIVSLGYSTEASLLNIRTASSNRITFNNFDKTYTSFSDIQAMLWIYRNTPDGAKLGITNMNGKVDPHLRVTNQNRMVTAYTLRDVTTAYPSLVKEENAVKAIVPLDEYDVFLFQSMEFQEWGRHIDIKEGAERLSLPEWVARNKSRVKFFQYENYQSLVVFPKKTSRRINP